MDAFDSVRTVLAVREFADKPIPAKRCGGLRRRAHLTASSRNGQPWHFVVVEDKDTLAKLGKAVTTGPYIAAQTLKDESVDLIYLDPPFTPVWRPSAQI